MNIWQIQKCVVTLLIIVAMKIQYCSDLHLEFHENLRMMNAKDPAIEVAGDILVIAGDVGYLVDNNVERLRLWKWMSESYRQVLMVAGNHEFYNNSDITEKGESWQKIFHPNVGYYHNKVVRIDDTDFIMSTLWSRISPVDEMVVQSGINDYRQILYNRHRLTARDITDEFEKNFAFIQNAVETSDAEKIVVVTHHLPTFAAIDKRYSGDPLNVAFATELGNYIADSRINAWVYGHAHHQTDLMIGNTHLVSNPLGYVFTGEHATFNDSAVIEI